MRNEYAFTWYPGSHSWIDPAVEALLKEYGTRYREKTLGNHHWVRFKLYDDKPVQKELIDKLKMYKSTALQYHVTAEYTEQELMEAKLLTMLPTRQQISASSVSKELDCDICPCSIQRMQVQIGKEHQIHQKVAFWSQDTGFGEVYADQRIRELVEEKQLSGFEFREVYLKTGALSQNLYKLYSTNVIETRMIEFGHGEKEGKCPRCGRIRYFDGDAYRLHVDFDQLRMNSDLYVTERIFGQWFETYPLYVVSHRVYELLVEKNLTKEIRFAPVVDVSASKCQE